MLVLALIAAACSGAPAPVTPAAPKRPNVVLVTLDTTRADRLGCYGYRLAQTDTLDRLAASGRRYARAYSVLPLTIPAHSSMFTGQYPPTLGVRSNGGGTLGEDQTTLAEVLRGQGYVTGAAVAAFVTTRQWGFAQGFDTYDDAIPEKGDNFWHGSRPGDQVVDDALAWKAAQKGDAPLFLWVHLYDPHFPYTPPDKYVDPDDPRPYDGEIAFVDDQVQRLVDAFAGSDTLFVVVGDHGEGLGEHDELNHGMQVYDATQHVPFLLSGAGVPVGEVVDTPVSLVDLLPTVLGVLGVTAPKGLDGRDKPAGGAEPVYMESWQLAQRFGVAPHLAIVDGPLKLIDTPRPELYDLTADPHELHDLSADRPADVARLRDRLRAWGFAAPSKDDTIDPGSVSALAALGYVDAGQTFDLSKLTDDPKDHRDLLTLVQRAEHFQAEHDTAGNIATWRELIRRYPRIVEFRMRLSSVLYKEGDLKGAAALVAEALKLDPSNPQIWIAEAGRLANEGKFADAAGRYRDAAIALPYSPRLRALTLAAMRRADQRVAAVTLGQDWHAAFPDDAPLAGALGILLVEQGSVDAARPLLTQGATADPPEPEVEWYLGVLDVSAGELEPALQHMRAEVDAHPENTLAAVVGARVSARLQRWDDQLFFARSVVAVHPRDAEMWHLIVLAQFNLRQFEAARESVAKGLAADPKNPDLVLMDANLIAKSGRKDEGVARFEEAKRLLAARQALLAQRSPSAADELGVPKVGVGQVVDPRTLPPWEPVSSTVIPP
jgi:arylsulfatase A-like enzyme/tetratricopeptide (TPR) repeat protein